MLKLTVTIEGHTQEDIEIALEEVQRLVGQGYLSKHDSNDDSKFTFDVEGEEDLDEEDEESEDGTDEDLSDI